MERTFSIPEAVMLLCFAVAWIPNIHKAYTSRTARGVSLPFMIVVLTGYVAGVVHKFLYGLDLVVFVYLLDAGLVLCGITLTIRNRALDRKAEAKAAP